MNRGGTMGPAVFVRDRSTRSLCRLAFISLLACVLAWPAATSRAAITCKPILSIKNVREIRASNLPLQPWAWTATIVADGSYCATSSGSFEIDFVRIKEYSPDVQFTEKYRWTRGQFDVTVELTADESIQDYRLGFIAPCVCRDLPFE
jgi:hypothetical protein